MPESRRYPMTKLPATLKRSSQEAQDAFMRALDDAVRAYGEGDQAVRAAYAALKREFEKRGDQWIAKQAPATRDDETGQLAASQAGLARARRGSSAPTARADN